MFDATLLCCLKYHIKDNKRYAAMNYAKEINALNNSLSDLKGDINVSFEFGRTGIER